MISRTGDPSESYLPGQRDLNWTLERDEPMIQVEKIAEM
jgi:hypothetical protein